MSALLAINWEPELRGILIVIISVTVLCGSVYLILGTNMGARLGFLVSLAALAGWMFIMGAIWWSYGQGLKGTDPSWQPVASQSVIRDPGVLDDVGIIGSGYSPTDSNTENAVQIQGLMGENGWSKLDPALPGFQQAGSAATVFMEESGALAAGEFTVVNVFDKGGDRYPTLFGGSVDFLAFFHDSHYVVVEVAPLVPQRTEPGRAPARPIIDESRSHEYIYMVRDMGNKRVPAAVITIASLVMFLVLCWLLHRRDRYVSANRSALPAKA
ncbi:MAG TPA: hypothetical protein DCR14_09655 [Acidimicrobiaceae bacterium]|nr:hypothetical protein [Acidimicrobiaceae bacterium]